MQKSKIQQYIHAYVFILLSATLLGACGEKSAPAQEALDSAQTHTEAAVSEAKSAAEDAVQAAKEAAAAAKAQTEESAEAAKEAIEKP